MEHDPSRIVDIDGLLEEYEGREAVLFDDLADEYPDGGGKEVGRGSFFSGEDEAEQSYILSAVGDVNGKWATNMQGAILRNRMMKAGCSKEDVEAIINNSSEMM